MSTYINVTVDGGGLSDKAKAQTNANRQAKLEGDNRQKMEAQGRDQRDATRAQQGIGPDGQPLYGTPGRSTLRRDEPAAAFRTPNGIEYGWFRLWTTQVQKRPNALYTGLGFPKTYSGYAPRLHIETANGFSYTDPDYEEAFLAYPPTYPYTGYLHGESYIAQSEYLLPVSKSSVILVICYKQFNVYNFILPGLASFESVTQEYETKDYYKAFLITPDAVKELAVPSSLAGFALGFAEPQYVNFEIVNGLDLIPLVRPEPANAEYQSSWLEKRGQIKTAMTQYGTMFFGESIRSTSPLRTRQFFTGGQANGLDDPLHGLSAAGPGAYAFLAQEQAFKDVVDAAYEAGTLNQLDELEVIRTYDWLSAYFSSSQIAKKVYGFDRDWSDLTQLVLTFYEINTPSEGWYAATFDGGLAEADLGYPPRKIAKASWLQLPLTVLSANFPNQAQAESVFFFTPGNSTAYCRQQALALGFTEADLTP
jgi:hypothetical protein